MVEHLVAESRAGRLHSEKRLNASCMDVGTMATSSPVQALPSKIPGTGS